MTQRPALTDLLHEAAETHHTVYRIVDGDDPDWASWYADWLIDLSELPELLGAKPVRSHLVHALVSGRHEWIGISGTSTEQDFVEAPSQMLEEWTWDPATLATFAKHHQTNEPIPATLVKQMRRASEFGKALGVRTQMVYAKLSLSLYDRDPKQVDTTAMVKELMTRYRPFPFVEGTHFQTSFGHLDGYSAVYYTYMWSLVIAKDLFSQFDRANLLAAPVAYRYRDTILVPGGSKPAALLVRDFLGRPFDFKAWEDWLNREEQ